MIVKFLLSLSTTLDNESSNKYTGELKLIQEWAYEGLIKNLQK